ncbi:MAG TPA: NADH-quinone oxidoreductase subunit L [Anaerolineaceae bacterium]|nr:NADH-quinone oxidoreductase subunit L [Anaerolineaceae bacterium]
MDILAGIPLAALIAGVVAELIFGRLLSTRGKGWLAFGFGLISLAVTAVGLAPTIIQGKTFAINLLPWQPESPVSFYVDGLSLLFALMATGIGSAILFYCIDYMAHEEDTTRFYVLMLIFIAGLYSLVASRSLLVAYLSWEVIGLCSYFLVGFWYREPAAANGAKKVLLMTHIPGYALLIAILLLYHGSGTFLWTDPALTAQFTTGIFVLFLVAAMAKSVIFPLHTWIPEAMNAPTPVSALLHSACYVKAGVYLVARLYSITPWQPDWNTIVMALGCVTIFVGALFALVETDLKRMLAFSTISQLGYIVTAFGIGTPLGALAGAFYVFSHGLFKGTLFLCAGAVQHAAGTRDMRQLGGLAGRMPGTTRTWLVATAAIIGVPLTNGFVAKWLLYDAALEAGFGAVMLVAWLVSTFTAFYMLKATVSVFYGEMPASLENREIEEASPRMQAGMGILAAACVLFGLAPQLLVNWIANPAVKAMGFPSSVELTFLGLHTGTASVPVTAGAVLAIAALLVAGLALGFRRPSPKGVSAFTGGDPLPEENTLDVDDFAEYAEDNFQPALQATNPDPFYLRLGKAVDWVAERLGWVAAAFDQRLLALLVLSAAVVAAAVWLS